MLPQPWKETTGSGAGGRLAEKMSDIVPETGVYQRFLDVAALTNGEEGIRQGLDDVAHGRTRPAKEVFDEIRRKHDIRPECGGGGGEKRSKAD